MTTTLFTAAKVSPNALNAVHPSPGASDRPQHGYFEAFGSFRRSKRSFRDRFVDLCNERCQFGVLVARHRWLRDKPARRLTHDLADRLSAARGTPYHVITMCCFRFSIFHRVKRRTSDYDRSPHSSPGFSNLSRHSLNSPSHLSTTAHRSAKPSSICPPSVSKSTLVVPP
jgi:hypothetical protein